MHPYHNSQTLAEIKRLQIEISDKRRAFELEVIKPLRDQIIKLKQARKRELVEADKAAAANF